MKASEIAKALNSELFGKDIDIVGISSPQNQKENTLVFSEERINPIKNVCVVSKENFDYESFIKVDDVKVSLAIALEKLYPQKFEIGISDLSFIESSAKISKDVYIGPFCYIGKNVVIEENVKVFPFSYIGENSYIGKNSIIYQGVNIYPKTIIGKNVIIHSGSVIGCDGFGYAITNEGLKKLNHIGNVIVEDNVEIKANTTIDRALLDSTIIGHGSKIDNLVMIGHNCKIGKNVILVSQVGLSGSVEIGDNSILAGQVGVADHVKIGKNVKVAAKSGIANDLESNKTYGANLPAIEWQKWKRVYVSLLKLPELVKDFTKYKKNS